MNRQVEPMTHQPINPLTTSMELYVIPFSHFCEKARWGLAYYGVPYTEYKYLPMLHILPMMWHTRGRGRFDRDSTPTSTPALLTEDGQRFCDSSDILRYLSIRFGQPAGDLYPSPRVRELEQLFSLGLGPDSRRVAYFYVMQSQALIEEIARGCVGRFQVGLIRFLYGLWSGAMRKALTITESRTKQSTAAIAESFAMVESLLSDGRPYLCGAQFTAADLTFAALASPVLWVSRDEGFGVELPPIAILPEPLKRLVEECRERPAGQFALRMYREHKPRLTWVGG